RPYHQVQYVMKMLRAYLQASKVNKAVMGRDQVVTMIKWVPLKRCRYIGD
ncbi:hypothetical protein A2U01_0051543, partial [Trifolium medium]|nr:hypothetical protein [Trifolium medium]